MAKAVWNGATIVETDDIAHVEGNAYFPLHAVAKGMLRKSQSTPRTFCHWKGFASYYDLVVDGEVCEGAGWVYEQPYDEARVIDGRIAFWRGVEVSGAPEGRGLVENEPSRRAGRSGWEALCWVMRSQRQVEGGVLNAEFLRDNTDLEGEALESAWREVDVQRYASRYKWQLAGGGGEAMRLEKTE
ncbi:MAG: DUF427 domain-containing protein [Rhodospirillales bacterium]|nr:DUF427 domain-containing protein [Rhodospirillales bacterium]